MRSFGGWLAYEEGKGDYAAARREIEARLAGGRDGFGEAALADALIDRAVVHLLQGEPADATRRLNEATGLTDDPDRRLLIASYGWFAELERFNTDPDGAGFGSLEISARWDGVAAASGIGDNWNHWRQRAADPAAILDATLARSLFSFLRTARYAVSTLRAQGQEPEAHTLAGFGRNCAEVRSAAIDGGNVSLAAYITWCTAGLHRRGGDTERAVALLNEARGLYEQARDAAGLGLCLMTDADWQAAPSTTPLAWNLYLCENIADASNTSFRTPPSWPDQPTVGRCRALYTEAETRYRQAAAPRGLAALTLRAGYLAFLDGEPATAMALADQAKADFETVGDSKGRAIAETHLVLARIAAGRPSGAAAIADGIGAWGLHHGSFSFCLSLAEMLADAGRFWLNDRGDAERAVAAFGAAAAFFEALGAAVSAARAVANQGFVYETVGDRASALTFFERSLERYIQAIDALPVVAGFVRTQATGLAHSVFNLYVGLKDGAGIERSVRRLRRISGLKQLAPLHLSLNFHQQNFYAPALQDHLVAMTFDPTPLPGPAAPPDPPEQTLRLMQAGLVDEAEDLADVLSPLYRARATRDAGDDKTADRLIAEAAAAALAKVHSSQRRFLMETWVLAEQKRYAEAADKYRPYIHAEIAALPPFDQAHGSLGALVRQRQKSTFDQAFTTFTRLRSYGEAKAYYEAICTLAGDRWWTTERRPWLSLSDIGEMYEGLGELDKARSFYDEGIAALEARRRQLSRDEARTALAADQGSQYLYFLACRTMFKIGDDQRALAYAERGKARALLDLMAGGDADTGAATSGETIRRWRQLTAKLALRRGLLAKALGAEEMPDRAQIDRLNRQIAEDEAALLVAEQDLAAAHPRFRDLITREAPPLTLSDIAGHLAPGTVLLEYVALGEDLLAWAIDRNGVSGRRRTAIDTRLLARDIRSFRDACAAQKATDEAREALAAVLLSPFAEQIRAARHLLIVPSGAGHQLPFQALPFDGEPLAGRRSVAHLPNASTLAYLSHKSGAPRASGLLVVGNPTGDLPGAAVEAADIAALSGVEPLIGKAATKAAVIPRLAGTSVLHFAAHATLSERAPLESWMWLAGQKKLTLYELLGLSLDADLVVMSACESGRGEITGGDEVLGLSRGLLAAGARAAIVSLWRVEDAATSLLMAAFYRELAREPRSPAAALARAQTWLRTGSAAALGLADHYGRLFAASGGRSVAAKRHQLYYRAHPEEIAFAHAHYWAGFGYLGA